MNFPTLPEVYDVAIVGAGMSGLAARRELVRSGYSVALLEKSRGLGGRCATKRGPLWRADPGAQFLTLTTTAFREALGPEVHKLRELAIHPNSRSPRYVHPLGMSSIARVLRDAVSETAPVFLNTRVVSILSSLERWTLLFDSGGKITAKSLILAIPLPQSVDLLSKSRILQGNSAADDSDWAQKSCCYSRCISIGLPLIKVDSPDLPAIALNPTPNLAGYYDQNRKGIEDSLPAAVAHFSEELSDGLWNEDDAMIRKSALKELARNFPLDSETPPFFVHRWRYSEVKPELRDSYLEQLRCGLRSPLPLEIAGDGLTLSSVESAYASGMIAAERICTHLGSPVSTRSRP